jgi:hypothetical protein
MLEALDALHTIEHHVGPYGAAAPSAAHAHITVAIDAALAARRVLAGEGSGRP